MKITQKVKKILANYESDNPGTKRNLASILMHGRLGGTVIDHGGSFRPISG